MTRHLFPFASILTLMALPAFAEGIKDARPGEASFEVSKKAKNNVTFTSKAPAETFKGTGKEVRGNLTLDPTKLDTATGEFAVPFKSLDTGNGGRNQHMLSARWIDAGKYPDAVFTVDGIEKVKVSASSVKASLKGTMKIHGQEQPMSIPVTLVYVKDKKEGGTHDTLAIKATFPIKLADFAISDMAVGKKVADTMRLAVAVTLESKGEKKATETTEGKKSEASD